MIWLKGAAVRAAAVLNAIAACVIGLYQVKEPLIRKVCELFETISVTTLDLIFSVALYASVVLIVISALLWMSAVITRLIAESDLSPIKSVSTRRCQTSDLDFIIETAQREFGVRTSTREELDRMFEYTGESFWILQAGKQRVGYFVVFGLKAAGEAAIRGGYYNGANPAPEHILRKPQSSKVACIGAMVGIGRKGKAATLGASTALIAIRPYKKIYTKPVSSDGLRIARGNGMKDLSGGEAQLSKYCLLERP